MPESFDSEAAGFFFGLNARVISRTALVNGSGFLTVGFGFACAAGFSFLAVSSFFESAFLASSSFESSFLESSFLESSFFESSDLLSATLLSSVLVSATLVSAAVAACLPVDSAV